MKMNSRLGIFAVLFFCAVAPAQDIGVTLLRSVTTNLDGGGITVAQPEASLSTDLLTWEVNPANVGRSPAIFTYASSNGMANIYPNALGANSWHAEDVGNNFYGIPNGIATNLARVDNFEADYFINTYIGDGSYPAIGDPIVNQSFTFGDEVTNLPTPSGDLGVSDQQSIDEAYDDYAVTNKTLFVSAANNEGAVSPPGTAYNSIGVGAYGVGANSSIGPTLDNGRCKPDITAPAGYTSFSTPLVSGAAAVLMQAALRGDGGGDTNSAADLRTIKALLLNGAVKPADWTNSNSSPLDARYGAGVLNIFNAYEQLIGGKNNCVANTSVSVNAAHPPNGAGGTVPVLNGWDFNTNTSSFPLSRDAVNHYYFNVTNGAVGVKFIAAATLVWSRHYNINPLVMPQVINNLNLFLYNCANSNLVNCSTSAMDNVEHIYMTNLSVGRYDLQVWKAGGINIISAAESYALAWEFAPTPTLTIANSGTNVALTWPVYPAGFLVEAETDLLAGVWSTNNLAAPVFTNGLNNLPLNATNTAQFFRLRAPNF
jgi:hypothetical protein